MRLLRCTVLLLTAVLLGVSLPARAEGPLALGVAPFAGSALADPDRAQLFATQLEKRTGYPVRVRLLGSEADLQRWMSLFREVDCGWFSEAYLQTVPAGELLPLVSAEAARGGASGGRLVVRQGLDAGTVQQLQTALVAMGADEAGAQLLGGLGLAGFAPVADIARGGRQPMALPVAQAFPEPVAAVTEPVAAVTEPVTAVTEPVTAVTEPVTAVTEPVAAVTEPVTADKRPQLPVSTPQGEGGKEAPPVMLAADRLDYDWGENLYRASGNVAISRAGMELQADQVHYDQNAELYRAEGAVVVQQEDTRLSTGKLLWQASTRDALAIGDVTIADADGELRGSSAQANLGNQRGRVTDGRVFLKKNNFHLTGKEIERLDQSSYRVTNGEFTTCDGDNPDWKFTAGEVNVDFGRYALARDVWFQVRDLPLFYLPYMVFPVLTERESGFLLPNFGYSDRKGAFLSLAWYQVIDRHLDATLYLDYLSELGLGKGVEFRYAFGNDSFGEMKGYHVTGFNNALDSDSSRGSSNDMPDSYSLYWRHGGLLPGQVRLTADVEYVDHIEYFEEFGDTADEYTRDQTVSTILLQRNWDKLNLTAFGRYINDLDESLTEDTTLQRLPELGLTVPFYRLDENPLYSRTQLTATHFWREDERPATALEPALESGQRFLLRQGLSLVLKVGELFEFTPEAAVYGRYYTGVNGEESDLIPEYSATLSSRLQRTYAVSGWGGLDRVQHSIEPQVTYRHVDGYAQDELPYYDPYDRIDKANLLSYALVNRLTGRAVDGDGRRYYRELLNLRLSQSYDIDAERDDRLDDAQPFSPLRAELRVNPTPETAVFVDSRIPVHGDLRFAKVNASANYQPSPGNSVAVSYSYVRDEDVLSSQETVIAQEPSEYVGLDLATSLLAPVYASFQERYDLYGSQSLESVLNLEYRAKCWSVFLTLRNRSAGDGTPSDNEVMIGFALSGLGRIGGFGSSLP